MKLNFDLLLKQKAEKKLDVEIKSYDFFHRRSRDLHLEYLKAKTFPRSCDVQFFLRNTMYLSASDRDSYLLLIGKKLHEKLFFSILVAKMKF